MSPIREYLCNYCGYQFEELSWSNDPDDYKKADCAHCESKADLLPSVIGGYQGNTGGASTRPKNSSAMKSKKAFTGHPGNQGEPPGDDKQLKFDFMDEE